LMNVALLGYAGYELYSQYYFTGYFVGLGLFNKTYNGSMHRATLLAEEKNLKELNEFNRKNSLLLINLIAMTQYELFSFSPLPAMSQKMTGKTER
jgi:hypothetical protein